MTDNRFYAIVKGGELLESLKQYRAQREEAIKAIMEWVTKEGGEAISSWPGQNTFFVKFDGAKPARPSQWKAENSKGGRYPKKGTEILEEMQKLPVIPSTYKFLEPLFVFTLEYRSKTEPLKNHGSSSLLQYVYEPWIGWAGDTFFIHVPNARAAAEAFLEENPGMEITNDIDKWEIPADVEVITKTKMEYLFAKHAMEEEEKEKTVA